MEAIVDSWKRVLRDFLAWQRHLYRVLLAEVPHISKPLDVQVSFPDALSRQFIRGLLFHLGIDPVQILRIHLVSASDERTDIVTPHVCHQHSPGRKYRRLCGDNDLLTTQLTHQCSSMHRSPTAEGD